MKFTGLRFEIVVSLVLLVVAAAGLMGLLVFKFMQNEMIALEINTGSAVARALNNRFDPKLPDGGVQWMVLELGDSGFDRVVVMDMYLRPMTWSGGKYEGRNPDRELLKMAIADKRLVTRIERKRWLVFGDGPTLSMAVPLFTGRRVSGVVGLYSNLAHLRSAWQRTRNIVLIFIGLDTLIVVLFGTILMSRRVVGPLSGIIGRVRDFAEGKYTPGSLNTEEPNEIDRLEEAFDQMAAQILSQRRRLEENLESLQQAQAQLVLSEKLATVGHLAAGLAHELGNPLGSLIGFTHLLRDADIPDEERLDYLDRMQSEMGRMDGIIRSLLDFARNRPERIGPVDMNKVVADALALTEVQKWFTGLTLETALAVDAPVAQAENGAVTQVILNLLVNAGQAMDGNGVLTVRSGVEGGEVFVEVSDTGPGIADEDLDRIFEPFFTKKEPGRGTGLGLSVSLSIMESFGGRIRVESRGGRGSAFKAILPAAVENTGE